MFKLAAAVLLAALYGMLAYGDSSNPSAAALVIVALVLFYVLSLGEKAVRRLARHPTV